MIVKSISPSSRAGPDTTGPSTIANVGTVPEHLVMARATRPQPSRAAMPSRMSAPALLITNTSGIRSSNAVRAAVSIV